MWFRGCALCLVVGVLVLVMPAAADDGGMVRYDNWKVVRVKVVSEEDQEFIRSIGGRLLSEAEGIGPVDYLFPPEAMPSLQSSGLSYQVLNDNIQRAIDYEREVIARAGEAHPRDPAWFTAYKNYDQVNAKLNQMAADRPDLASVFVVGTSIEGRAIYGIRISGPGTNKPAIQFNGCHHAREWISVMVPMWIADKLVYEYDTNPRIRALVDALEIYIIPIVNPDGYVYSWNTDRMWRKNRRNNGGGCWGVDLNRNYSVGWGGGGSSSNPCSETYRGTAAFSEPESAAMRDFTQARPQIVATQSYHSYSQLIMSPYGYTSALPADHEIFMELNAGQRNEIFAVHGVNYNYGPIYSTIYQASGNDVDWYYDIEGIFAFTTELRDTGTYGFLLPPEQIIPCSEENFAAALYLAEWCVSPVKFSFPNGLPTRLTPNTPQAVRVKIFAVGASLDPSSPRLYTRVGTGGSFTTWTLTPLGSDLYEAVLPGTPCGRRLYYYFSAATTTGVVGVSPAGAPETTYSVLAPPILTVLNVNMDTNPGWSVQGQWAWGQPTGGGSHNHDPTSGFTGLYVYGYNLNGDYPNNMTSTLYLTTTPIDCTGLTGVHLSFYRWLGVESNNNYDKATIDVSGNNGSTWTTIWRAVDTGGAVADTEWVYQEFDISAIADNRPQVRIRWGMGPTDGSVTYPGWNVDDVVVWGDDPNGCPPELGDLNCDGLINAFDIDPFVLALTDPAGYQAAFPNCDIDAGDINGDGVINAFDIDPFVELLTGGQL